MRRWLLTLACAASLLICAIAMFLWWRSGSVSEYLCREENAWAICVISDRGQLIARAQWTTNPDFLNPDDAAGKGWRHVGMRSGLWDAPPRPPYRIHWRFAGFMYRQVDTRRYAPTIEVAAPYWAIAGSAAVPPLALLLRQGRRRRRTQSKRCAQCGYDLRATPDRCPECGAVPCDQIR